MKPIDILCMRNPATPTPTPAPFEFVGAATSAPATTSGSAAISLSSGLTGGSRSSVQAGDLVIAALGLCHNSAATLGISDGTNPYILIGSQLYSDSVTDTNLRVAYKVMGGTPDASTTFTFPGVSASAQLLAVYVFSGVDATTPLDVAATTATGTGTGRANPPSITPTTTGAKIVAVGCGTLLGTATPFTSSDLASFSSITQLATRPGVLGIGRADWTSGAFDPAQFGGGSTDGNRSWSALTLALRPA